MLSCAIVKRTGNVLASMISIVCSLVCIVTFDTINPTWDLAFISWWLDNMENKGYNCE